MKIFNAALTALLLFACAAASAAAPTRFDVDVSDAPARQFFLGLARRGGENVVVHPKVAGTLTLSMRGVTVAETLDAAREMYGFEFRRVAAGYFVMPARAQLRMFQVNYLDLNRTGTSRTSVSSGSIAESGRQSTDAGSVSVAGTAGATSPESSGSGSPDATGTNIVTQTATDFWSQLEASLRALVGTAPDHNVVINRHSGMVAVRADPDELRSVAEYLAQIQRTVSRQVVLEAKIIEVQLNDAFQAGINWATVLRDGRGTYFGGQASPPDGFDANLLNSPGRDITVSPGNPVQGFVNRSLGGAFLLAVDLPDFNVLIDLLSTQGNARVLSSPRVATLHNQKAVIKAGTDEFFVTKVSSDTVTGNAVSTSRDVELTPFFSGIALDVTPQISDDDRVTLHVHPSVSDVRDQTKRVTVDGKTDELPLAISEIRESDSIVQARSGQTIIIGGLMRDSKREQRYATPWLSGIPGLGNLFKSRRDVSTKTELVILLRPIIVDDPTSAQLAQDAEARAEKLGRAAVR